jgi:hypothetical protein
VPHDGRARRAHRAETAITTLFDLLDEARGRRNNVSYAAGFAVPADVEETAGTVLVDAHVSPHLPD